MPRVGHTLLVATLVVGIVGVLWQSVFAARQDRIVETGWNPVYQPEPELLVDDRFPIAALPTPAPIPFPPDSPDTDEPEPPPPFPIKRDPWNPFTNPEGPFDTERDGGFYLEHPAQTEVEYDPVTGDYVFERTVGDTRVEPPKAMDLRDYMDYDMKETVEEGWTENKEDEEEGSAKALRPTIKVASETFDRIFGGDVIEIRPNGSAELIFGVNVSRTDNPAIPEKQRRVATFDFQEKIQLNVIGNIGDKLKLTTNYNTEATFDFENQMKLEYTGYEDDIIQKIEAGNVSLPLKGQLITGSQSLFGIKTALQFGRLTVTSVFSQQKGQKSEIDVEGGAQITDYEVKADQYDNNRHFFLSHFFRDQYETAVGSPPLANTGVLITRLEVWVTNTNSTTENTRNVIAFQDLGEGDNTHIYNKATNGGVVSDANASSAVADNDANNLYQSLANNAEVRAFTTSTSALTTAGLMVRKDYQKIELARKLGPSEYTYHPQFGYVSVNQTLNVNQVLAVSFQYTLQGQTYQVGDFSTDGINGQDALYLKMLKSTESDTRLPMWDLMMKNIYSIGAYQLQQDGFELDVWYLNQETGIQQNYLADGGAISGLPLTQVLGLDKLNTSANGVPTPDGRFDWIVDFTLRPENGRIIFPLLEPFGSDLTEAIGNATVAKKYAFDSLYTNTQANAQVKFPERNRFSLKGRYKSSQSSEISLNAINIPEGSVSVSAGGQQLVENQDYTVDYTLGRVKIINQGILESGTPIKVNLESNQAFNIQSRSLFASRLDYKISDDFVLGGTIMNLSERPITQKVNIGDEPMSNTIWGVDGDYTTESQFLTNMVDKIPLINTKEKSTINFSGEFAQLLPGHSRAVGKEGTSYIDDFEGSQSAIDIRSFSTWQLASVPHGQPNLFPEAQLSNNRAYGFNRALLNWYVIDPLFFRDNNLTPNHIKDNDDMQSDHRMREVFQREVFPNRQLAVGTPSNIPALDLSFYPSERGPYNYDVDGFEYQRDIGVEAVAKKRGYGVNADGTLKNPEQRWGGMMRRIETSDFDAANVEFIQFWLMDPFHEDYVGEFGDNNSGTLYFNIGNLSEDILQDSRRTFENNMPTTEAEATVIAGPDFTVWGRTSTQQSQVNAFDNNPQTRAFQDVGLDGLRTQEEEAFFDDYLLKLETDPALGTTSQAYTTAAADPSTDNYNYFRDDDYDANELNILERYKKYNGQEGNSPTAEQSATQNSKGFPTTASTLPNTEDVNRDFNMEEGESYYQYSVKISASDLRPENIGNNYITDVLQTTVSTQNNERRPITWYQFKIPVRSPEKVLGGIADFRSIRFMRIFMQGFEQPINLRFARLDLIRGEWRKYDENLDAPGEYIAEEDETLFNVAAVNIEENGSRQPVNYILPPDIQREISIATTNLQQLNEQSMSLRVCGLPDGAAKAAYKNVDLNVLMYKRLKMFLHCEAGAEGTLNDGDLHAFIRIGSDFNNNYYEYEVPLEVTAPGNYGTSTVDKEEVWKRSNEIDLAFSKLTEAKQARNIALFASGSTNSLNDRWEVADGANRIYIVGNPNLATLKTIMIGIRNPKAGTIDFFDDDGQPKCAEVWANELRLIEFDQTSGWAAIGRVTANLADFANVSLAGAISTPGFGSVEKKVSERQRETITQVDASTTVNLDQFFPETWGLKLPMYLGFSEGVERPQFSPLDPDIRFNDYLNQFPNQHAKDSVRKTAEARTIRRSMNFTNIRKEKTNSSSKPKVYDISNWTGTYSYSEQYKRDINTETDARKTYRGGLAYTFSTQPKSVEPFKKVGFLSKSNYYRLIKEFNFSFAPKQVSFKTDLNRTYGARKTRNISPGIRAELPTYYEKTFNWTRDYDLKWDLTKSLKFDFNASNIALIGEPQGVVNRKFYPEQYDTWRDSVWSSIADLGTTTTYHHATNLNYTLPINKFPLTDWINSTARYSSTYGWQRAPFAADTLGHTIQNSNSINLNASANMQSLYNKIGYLKKVNRKLTGQGAARGRGRGEGDARSRTPKPNPADTTKNGKPKKRDEDKITPFDRFFGLLMSLRSVSGTYAQTNGVLLPGYNRQTRVIGMDQGFEGPGYGFLFGQNDGFGPDKLGYFDYAASKDWLVRQSNVNTPSSITWSENVNIRATVEPLKDLRIELSANRTQSSNLTEFFRWSDSTETYQHNSQIETRSYSITYPVYATAFVKSGKDHSSTVFQQFLDNREAVSQRLGGSGAGAHETDAGYSEGYGSTAVDVLIPAFLAAYSGQDVNDVSTNPIIKIPLPNWRVTYSGLTKMKLVKKYFKNATVSHVYRSTYSVNGYMTNLNYTDGNNDGLSDELDLNANYYSAYQINAVTIAEQFSPLFNLDLTWNNSLLTKIEHKRSRTLSLSFANTQLTETRNTEWTFGLGYRFDKVVLPFRMRNNKKIVSDLNTRADVSVRDQLVVIRKVVENESQPTSGQKAITISINADYAINDRLTLRAFYDRVVNKPVVSLTFPTANTNAGLSIRFTLAS